LTAGFFTEELQERLTGLYGVTPTIDFVEIAQMVSPALFCSISVPKRTPWSGGAACSPPHLSVAGVDDEPSSTRSAEPPFGVVHPGSSRCREGLTGCWLGALRGRKPKAREPDHVD
jgi:hypothetical protein